MAQQQVDVMDLVPAMVFSFVSAVQLGIVGLLMWTDVVNLSEQHAVPVLDNFMVSLAFIINIVTIGVIWYTNEADLDYLDIRKEKGGQYNKKYDQLSRYMSVGMIVLVVAIEFISEINNAVVGDPVLAPIALIIMGGGIWGISWAA